METQKSGNGALSDIRVLDLAGPVGSYCTKLLADLGADVIKVEPPGGDSARKIGPFVDDKADPEKSLFFYFFNSNKRGITLDIEVPEGQALLKRLIQNADIVVDTFPPAYLEKVDLGYQTMAKVKSDVILTSITGFGSTGPYSNYKWSDIVGLAMGGLMWLAGFPDDPPNCLGGYQGFLLAGTNGAIGTLLALTRRDASGKGCHVDVSMQEAVIPSTELSVPAYVARKFVRKRTGRQVYKGWNELYPCKDGYVMCSPFGGGKWKEVLQWAASQGKAGDLMDQRYQEVLDIMADVQMDRQPSGTRADKKSLATFDAEVFHIEQVWENFLQVNSKQQLYEKCQSMGVALMPIYDAADQLRDPQLLARKWFVSVEHDELDRTLVYPGPPYRLSETPWIMKRRPPLIGEHNTEVYQKELGLSSSALLKLQREGVI